MDMLSSSRGPALFRQAAQHSARCAIHSEEEGDFTYQQLLEASGSVASSLKAGIQDLQEARVAYLAPAGFQHVAIQWGIWRAGGVAVPLCPQHSASELSGMDSSAFPRQRCLPVSLVAFRILIRPVALSSSLPAGPRTGRKEWFSPTPISRCRSSR
jgi:malonyl-CoA/methylmalonyl-CoA synthetase